MSGGLRFRYPSPVEPYTAYAPFLVWPLIWGLPYGYWTWAIAFAPDLLMSAFRRLRGAPSTRAVSARRTGSGVELVDGSGAVIESFRDAEVEALTRMVDKTGRTTALRVGRRKGSRDLIFEAGNGDVGEVARELGLDLKNARGRYRTGSRALRLSIFWLIGAGIIVWSLVSPPTDPDVAHFFVIYTNWITMPLVVLFAIPTWVDVGSDGVAWKWLFLRRYLSFASMATMEPIQRGNRIPLVKISMHDRSQHRIWPTKESGSIVGHLAEAFANVRLRKEAPAESADSASDESLRRRNAETVLAWVGRLRGIAAGVGGYRGASVDHLWEVAEAVDAPVERRVSALLVLASTEEARERIRAIAARVVAPDVRKAFEAIADGIADEAIAKVFETVLDS